MAISKSGRLNPQPSPRSCAPPMARVQPYAPSSPTAVIQSQRVASPPPVYRPTTKTLPAPPSYRPGSSASLQRNALIRPAVAQASPTSGPCGKGSPSLPTLYQPTPPSPSPRFPRPLTEHSLQPKRPPFHPSSQPVAQCFWLRGNNGTVTWQNGNPRSTAHRPSGDLRWYSWWRPREYNQLLDVYENFPEASRVDDLHPHTQTSLRLVRENLSAEDLTQIGTAHNLRDLELTGCSFPDQWSTTVWSNLRSLHTLVIYSPGKPGRLLDDMAGLAALPSLRVLRLVRCDFANTSQGFGNLAAMRNLTYLDLDRTITSEKAAASEESTRLTDDGRQLRHVDSLDPAVMRGLLALVQGGRLRRLSVQWCTALTKARLQRLVDEGFLRGCQVQNDKGVTPSPNAQLEELLDRIR
jgi:hypothetical protein